jgi:hypothetical protein
MWSHDFQVKAFPVAKASAWRALHAAGNEITAAVTRSHPATTSINVRCR